MAYDRIEELHWNVRNVARKLESHICSFPAVKQLYNFVEFRVKDQCFNIDHLILLSSGRSCTWNTFDQNYRNFPVDDFTEKVNSIKQQFGPTSSDSINRPVVEEETNEPEQSISSKQKNHDHIHSAENDDESSAASSTTSSSQHSINPTMKISDALITIQSDENGSEQGEAEEQEEEEVGADQQLVSVSEGGIPQVSVSEGAMQKFYLQSHYFINSIVHYFNESYRLDQSMQFTSHYFLMALDTIHEEYTHYFYDNIPSILNIIGKRSSTLYIYSLKL